MTASLAGVLFVSRAASAFIERNVHLLVTFAAGVFVVFAWQLAKEVFEHLQPFSGLAWIAGGALAITLLCKLLPHRHGETQHQNDRPGTHQHVDAHRMIISDAIHNAGDGILLAASFAVSPALGFAAAIGVFFHEVIQEIAEFFVLRDAGYSVRRALRINFVTASTILIGALGGYAVLELFETVEGPLLAVVTGGVLMAIFYDLIPHSIRDARTHSTFAQHAVWLMLGVVMMFSVVSLAPHENPEHSAETARDRTLEN